MLVQRSWGKSFSPLQICLRSKSQKRIAGLKILQAMQKPARSKGDEGALLQAMQKLARSKGDKGALTACGLLHRK